ncbi:MAG: helix-turn-helix domain-containing protein [Geoalkalibacter sp.]|uniref:helix-turn-helix domain-containing protein n=1 Tax=Geoalkalibacter sp. TaxID=3041440 RepID=UPI003D0C426F
MSETEFYGDILKNRRRERQLSLDDVARQTRMRTAFLEALEEGRFEEFPAETYVKGFLRNYSEFLGLDSETLLDIYQQQRPAVADVDSELRRIETGLVQPVQRSSTRRSLLLFLGIAALILIGLAVGYFLTQKPGVIGVRPESQVPVDAPGTGDPVQNGASSPSSDAGTVAETEGGVPPESTDPAQDLSAIIHPGTAGPINEKPASDPADFFSPPPVTPGATLKIRAVAATQLEVAIDQRPRQHYALREGSVLTWRIQQQAELIVEQPESVAVLLGDQSLDFGNHSKILITTGE